MALAEEKVRPTQTAFREFAKSTHIDFIGFRNKAFALSAIIVGLGLLAFIMTSLGKANMSVDFTGGTSVQVRFADKVSIGEVRKAFTDGGLNYDQIQEVAGTKDFLIKTKASDTGQEKIQDKVTKALSTGLQGKKFEIVQTNMVGPSVGHTLKKDAIIAIVLALAAIIVYIWFRFTFIFGIAATIATFHDVLALLGIFWALGMEMNILFITALLTVAGYSLSDTVVIFDRIRENTGKMKSKADLGKIINTSINEVLHRTLVTGITTLLALAAILVLGGAVLFDFALALFIGVLVGTYSSIFVASPIVYLWRKRAV